MPKVHPPPSPTGGKNGKGGRVGAKKESIRARKRKEGGERRGKTKGDKSKRWVYVKNMVLIFRKISILPLKRGSLFRKKGILTKKMGLFRREGIIFLGWKASTCQCMKLIGKSKFHRYNDDFLFIYGWLWV